jgi:hypothetical protein
MITAQTIRHLRRSADDYDDAENLKAAFVKLRAERVQMFLTGQEFDEILHWKLRGQYGRQRALRTANTEEVIRTVTQAAFSVSHADADYLLELRVGILCVLKGVAVPVASAILALVFPDQYAVIDFRNWRQVFDDRRTAFSISDYKRYMMEIRKLSRELSWPVQEVDLAIWEYDRRQG